FDNVSVDLGSIYRDFVDPLITNLQDSLRPIKPVVDFLTQPLPVISDLYEMAGLGPQTVVSLAGYGPNSSLVRTLNIVDAVLDYTGPNSSNVDGPEALFSFEVSKTGVDPQTAANREEAVRNNLKKLDEGGLRFELAEKHQDPDKHRDWQTSLSWKSQFDGSIDLPFLTDFETLAGLLLGDTQSEMFTFDVNASFGFDVTVDVPIVPLLNLASLTGRISFALDLDLDGGYDATGIKRLTDAADFSSEAALRSSLSRQDSMLLAGFYLDDHNSDSNSDHGRLDAPEATFTVEMGAGLKAGIDLLLMQFELGGEIVLESNLNFDLNDLPEPEAWSGNTPLWSNVVCYDPSCTTTNSSEWQYDGRVRLAELATIVDADPGAIFNMDGALKAGFDATLDVSVIGIPIISERWQLLRMTLVNGNLHQPNDAVIIHGENPPELAVINKSGVLTLHMGDDAWKRNRDASVTDEVFTVQSLGTSKDGGETVMVTFESNGETYTQFFQGVTRVRAYGGTGNDTIQVLPGIEAGALIVGGDGDDVITYGGSGKAILVGNAGNDFITGGSNNDRIIGYDGDDHLDGGAGNDYIVGGAGNDKMIGGAGNDQLTGNIGDDFLDGGDGVDRLYGSAGDDILRGGNGTDYVFGQAGNDRIQYGFLIDGDAAVDQMLGGPHRDTVEILGTENADVFTVQQLSNGVFRITNAQNATFRFRFPESITDRDIEQLRVSGMGGDDHIEAIGNFDVNVLQLDGGEGDDTLIGAESRNELLGGAGDDMLIGGSSRDILRGGDGSDTLRGGGSNDALYGDDGDDDLNGEEGTDVSRGGNGNDTIDAGVGLLGDMIYGDAGDDTLNGGDGVDIIFGGMGNDTIHGGALGDTLIGDEGDDYIVGGTGRDFIFGGDGNDQLFALSADSLVDALEATDDWREVYSKLLERENDIINVESPGNQSEIND
ncbi:MAG: calcium-binding protein, partial [Planctomycetales bacterium]|nr:calcium-binding protein [Planctomycetales bacterium]